MGRDTIGANLLQVRLSDHTEHRIRRPEERPDLFLGHQVDMWSSGIEHEIANEHAVAAIGNTLRTGRPEERGHLFHRLRSGARQHDVLHGEDGDDRGDDDGGRDQPLPRRDGDDRHPQSGHHQQDRPGYDRGPRHAGQQALGPIDEDTEQYQHRARKGTRHPQKAVTPRALGVRAQRLEPARDAPCEQDRERRQDRQDVPRLLAYGDRVEQQWHQRPDPEPDLDRLETTGTRGHATDRLPPDEHQG